MIKGLETMVNMTTELLICLREFQTQFGDIVPLRELSQSVTTEELLEAIKISIEKNENILPQKFGYDELDKNPNILI